jgi:hypothetical protein
MKSDTASEVFRTVNDAPLRRDSEPIAPEWGKERKKMVHRKTTEVGGEEEQNQNTRCLWNGNPLKVCYQGWLIKKKLVHQERQMELE